MRLQNKAFVVYTAAIRVHPEREDAVEVQAIVQAAFDRDTPLDPAVKKTESVVATCCHNQREDQNEGWSSSLRWGCREHFVSGCWHCLGRDRGRYPRSASYLLWECCILASL